LFVGFVLLSLLSSSNEGIKYVKSIINIVIFDLAIVYLYAIVSFYIAYINSLQSLTANTE